jgi:long-chain acyl-CoA synthetase
VLQKLDGHHSTGLQCGKATVYCMNLFTAFQSSASQHSGKTALYWGDLEISYGQFLNQSLALADRLQTEFGVRPGDHVGLWLKNCPEFIPALFGVLAAGGVVVPINNFLKAEEVSYILADADVTVLITQAAFSSECAELSSARPRLKLCKTEDFPALSVPRCGFHVPDSTGTDLAVIVYTSGTTGRPKGAMLSHSNLLSNVESCRQVLKAVDHDRFAVLLPMFHSFMLTVGLLLPLLVGGSILLVKSLHPVKNVLQEIILRQATLLPCIPQFFRTLAETAVPDNLPLRLCISGAAPLPTQVLKEFSEKFPIPLLEGYGLSEASPVVAINPIQGPWKTGSIGKPIPGVAMSIQNDAGNQLADEQVGEVCVQGPNVMQGYWNQPEETARALRSGWLLTGDVGYRDQDGFYFITDRKKDMLLVNGINVYPREIEEVIYQFPGVKEAAVIGIPDARKGEQPVAFVAPAGDTLIQEKALLQFVRGRLADYKVPRRVHFLSSLPRNATGKILKAALREQAADDLRAACE